MATFYCHVTISDAYNRKFTKRFVGDFADFDLAYIGASTLVGDLENIEDGKIEKFSVGAEYTLSNTVEAGANRDEGITIVYDLGGGKRAVQKVSAPNKAALDSNGNLDLTDSDWAAWFADFVGGPWTISDGETPVGVIKATLDK